MSTTRKHLLSGFAVLSVLCALPTLALAQVSPGPTISPTPDGGTAGLSETDSSSDSTFAIDGDSNHSIHGIRAGSGSDPRRIIAYENSAGQRLATFIDNPAIYPILASGSYNASAAETLVCAQVATQFPNVATGLGITCAVKSNSAGAFGAAHTQMGPSDSQPNAFLGDLCPGAQGADFVALYKPGQNPIADVLSSSDPQTMMSAPACRELLYSAATGWTVGPATRCSCDELPGATCTDPCFIGTGTIGTDGKCDTSHLKAACDDGDPNTADSCTGIPNNLCQHQTLQ